MVNNTRRLQRLERALLVPENLSPEEEVPIVNKFYDDLKAGTAAFADLDSCKLTINCIQRELLEASADLHDVVEVAGPRFPMNGVLVWAARVLHVPAGEPVPAFILETLEGLFETAWDLRPLTGPRDVGMMMWQHHLTRITIGLRTPDAAEFREQIADGEFDGANGVVPDKGPGFWKSVKPSPRHATDGQATAVRPRHAAILELRRAVHHRGGARGTCTHSSPTDEGRARPSDRVSPPQGKLPNSTGQPLCAK